MTLDPKARAFLEWQRDSGQPRLFEQTPEEVRAGAGPLAELIGAGPAVEQVEDLTIPVDGAAIEARRYRPAGAHGTIVWFHGGGWVVGGIETSDAMCRMLAEGSRATVVSVGYRLAPEHPFPTPLEDCYAALCFLAEHEAAPLVVGGDSAGGNLAAVCALRARDRGGPELAAQLLVYPVTDSDMETASYREHGDSELPMLGTREMTWFFDHYLPDGVDRTDPQVAPLRAPDLSRLPPAFVVLAEYDPLRDEVLRYAERLEESGVEVTLLRYDDQPHGFFGFVNIYPTGNVAVADVGARLRALLS